MKQILKSTALVFTLAMGFQSQAVVLLTCESGESVAKRAEDELCDHLVEASEDCFKKVNAKYSQFIGRPANVPAVDALAEAEPIKDTYEAAIVTVKAYLDSMRGDGCGDQRERIDVMVDELNKDLKEVKNRIGKIKPKVPKK